MKVKTMEAGLYCTHCGEETDHEITYINEEIKSVRCEQCNRTKELRVDLSKEFYKEVYERVSTKPTRITKEYQEDLNHFLFTLPVRVVSKPYRLIKDVKASQRIIRNYRPKK